MQPANPWFSLHLFDLDISYQLLLMIGYFSTATLLEMDAIPTFGNGVGNWLELEVFKRKQIGLVCQLQNAAHYFLCLRLGASFTENDHTIDQFC